MSIPSPSEDGGTLARESILRAKAWAQNHATGAAKDACRKVLESVSNDISVEELVTKLISATGVEVYNNFFRPGNPESKIYKLMTIVGIITDGLSYVLAFGQIELLGHTLSLALAEMFFDVRTTPVTILSSLVTRILRCVLNQRTHELKTEGPDDDDVAEVCDVLTALWQTIAVAKGAKASEPKNISDLAATVFDDLGKVSGKTRNLTQMFKNLVRVIKTMYTTIMDTIFGITPMHKILYRDSDVMRLWTMEADFLLQPQNEYKIMNDKFWFERLAMCDKVASLFVMEMNQAGRKDVPPMFLGLHKRVRELYIKGVNMGVLTAHRPEPVCVWVSGPSGLGKTYVKDTVIKELLLTTGREITQNDIYTVGNSQKHWTGCEGKPVVYYDDFAIIEDPATTPETDAQFMALISDARFSPPQADIPDKGKCMAPVLVYVNCNQEKINHNWIVTKEAFSRRRHFCIDVRRSAVFREKFGDTANLETPGALAWAKANRTPDNMAPQADFRFYNPVTLQDMSEWMSYKEMLVSLREKFFVRYLESQAKFEEKVHMYDDITGVNCGLPLADVLEKLVYKVECITRPETKPTYVEWRRCQYTLSESKKSIRQIWGNLSKIPSETYDMAKSWFNKILGQNNLPTMATEMADEAAVLQVSSHTILPKFCSCAYSKFDSWIVKDKKLYERINAHAVRLCLPIEPCCDTCRMKTTDWQNTVINRLTHMGKSDVASYVFTALHPDTIADHEEIPLQSGAILEEMREAHPQIENKEWSTAAKVTAGLLGTLAVVMGMFGIYKMISGRMNAEKKSSNPEDYESIKPQTQILASGDNVTSKGPATRGIARKHVKVTTQAVAPPKIAAEMTVESLQDFTSIIDRNICYLILSGEDRNTKQPVEGFPMRCLGICGTWIALLKHYVAKINRTNNAVLRFINNTATVNREIALTKYKQLNFENSEVALIQLPSAIPNFKDIRTHFMREDETHRMTNVAHSYEKALGVTGVLTNLTLTVRHDVSYDDAGVKFNAPTLLTYNWQSPGRCMTPIISKVSGVYKIVGLHICGGNGTGGAEPVVRETFDVAGEQFEVQMAPEEFVDPTRVSRIELDGDFWEEGIATQKYSVRPSEKSQIVASAIHGYVPATTCPAPLTPKDVNGLFSPLVTGCNKHGKPPKGFDTKLIQRAKEHLLEQYIQNCTPAKMSIGVLTVEQAVLGFPGLDGYQAMEMSTSEGFPFTASRPSHCSNKRWLFNINETGSTRELLGLDPLLHKVMEEKNKLRDSGVIPFTVFTDCLKDARIAKEKFEQPGKTRIFSISPTDFTIQFRQYFLDILAAQKLNRIKMEHMVGMNVHSMEWTILARCITSKGSAILCGDYSNFGPGLDSEIVKEVGDVWATWYDYHEAKLGVTVAERVRRRRVRAIMFEEMRHSVHLCKDIFYRVGCGSPSGAPPTVNINNDVNKFYVYMAWLHITSDKPLYNNFVAFNKHIALFVYGDDLIMNVSDEVKEWFNNVTISNFLAQHDIKYTDETKGDTIRAYGTFADASFLKGKFKEHDTRGAIYNYALDPKSIEDCANWVRNGTNLIEATREAICDSLMLAYGQGEAYFNHHRRRLLEEWNQLQAGPLYLYTYEDMDLMRHGDQVFSSNDTIEALIEKEAAWRERLNRERNAAKGLIPLMTEVMGADFSIKSVAERYRQQERIAKKLLGYGQVLRNNKLITAAERQIALMNRLLDELCE